MTSDCTKQLCHPIDLNHISQIIPRHMFRHIERDLSADSFTSPDSDHYPASDNNKKIVHRNLGNKSTILATCTSMGDRLQLDKL